MIRITLARTLADLTARAHRVPALLDELKEARDDLYYYRAQHHEDADRITELLDAQTAPAAVPDGVERVILTEAGRALADRSLVVWEWPATGGWLPRWRCRACRATPETEPGSATDHARTCTELSRI